MSTQELSARLFTALRLLRTTLMREGGDGVLAYHIFGYVCVVLLTHCLIWHVPFTVESMILLWSAS